MTILSCQKRHHEPHITEKPRPSPYGWRYSVHWCDGRAVWPYARPKPPRKCRINSAEFAEYQKENGTVSAHITGRPWEDAPWAVYVYESPHGWDDPLFPTHAEAITYAQNLVNERIE